MRLLDLIVYGRRAIRPQTTEPPHLAQARRRLSKAQVDFYEAVAGVVEDNQRLRKIQDARKNH